jgi:methionyl-tRNA formyltransferase
MALSADEIQPEGRKPMKTPDFLRGFRGENSGRFEI